MRREPARRRQTRAGAGQLGEPDHCTGSVPSRLDAQGGSTPPRAGVGRAEIFGQIRVEWLRGSMTMPTPCVRLNRARAGYAPALHRSTSAGLCLMMKYNGRSGHAGARERGVELVWRDAHWAASAVSSRGGQLVQICVTPVVGLGRGVVRCGWGGGMRPSSAGWMRAYA